jgi:hypothetical protein
VQGKKLTGDVKGAVDVMEERLTEVKVMKQMELTETTRKLGKCTVVKVVKQMEPKVHRGQGHEGDGAHLNHQKAW